MLPIIYITAEIGLDCGLATYSGGLGVLSGDHVRSAADLGLPFTCVTLYYRQGYGQQSFDTSGQQRMDFPSTEPGDLLEAAGELSLDSVDGELLIKLWRRRVCGSKGTVDVLFIDADCAPNPEPWRQANRQLYGGDEALRLRQELLLGQVAVAIGRAAHDDEFQLHLNEGHCAMAPVAWQLSGSSEADIRSRTLFTTHTPVAAGHDRFDSELVRALVPPAMRNIIEGAVGLGTLNMSHLAAHYARAMNGVSKTNAKVAEPLFPGREIAGLTNGVHHRKWCLPVMAALFDTQLPGWRETPELLAGADSICSDALARARGEAKIELCDYTNASTRSALRADRLTLGFARRMTPYKRGNLLFHNEDRLMEAAEAVGGLQIVFAGKSHPKDGDGQAILKLIFERAKRSGGLIRVALIPDYSMWHGRLLTGGVDLWLNNPIRPLEASGTSGMKASLQGVPNLSILDGWWVEGCQAGVNGFTFGGAKAERDDRGDSEGLYACLIDEVAAVWADDERRSAMQKAAIATAAEFTSERMVGDYAERFYRGVV
jgi:starch phosphorylase